jgi:RimJ/RimL family protein N-acetyltransferase
MPERRPPADNDQMDVFLRTERLVLRRFTADDVDHLHELDSDPQVMRYLNGGTPTPREEVSDKLLPFLIECYDRFDGLGFWAAQTAGDGQFLGWFQFRPLEEGVELGYRLRRPAWGAGYATEGSRALIRKGFTEHGVERVVAFTMAVNQASRRVMEKCGLRLVRTYPAERTAGVPGSEHGEVEYALNRADWQDADPPGSG